MPSKPFEQKDIIRDPDGVVAPVTMRIRDGRVELSFSLQKEFDKDGGTQRTIWLKREHIDAVKRLLERIPAQLDLVEDRIRAERRQGR